MLRRSVAMAKKDLRLALSGGQGLVQALLLGLLLIFLFSLSRPTGALVSGQSAAAIFWLASAFGLVLVFNDLFSLEEAEGARLGVLTSPAPVHCVMLGKGMAGLLLLLVSQAVFLPATAVFLGQSLKGGWPLLVGTLLAADFGLASVGALLGALGQGQNARESLLTVVVFPLLLPLLLGAIKLFSAAFIGEDPAQLSGWVSVIVAFDGLFAGAGLILFPFVYGGEE